MKKEEKWDYLFENISKVGEDFEDKKDLPIQERKHMETNIHINNKPVWSNSCMRVEDSENQLLESLLTESDKDSFNITEEDRQWLNS
ncbi:hypothetical protein [Francisella philomiragia]|uniref:Uncharacterized protein n=1 Tax=Francisella philomiragia TaxID=28110 RepID=A0ABS1GA65_9GAMM|nr:hypothetical protein [Francisella philomiragia]MBK2258016.1 hypothetical protein [Francisella philomiragia]MBK2267224.1 hypothetical protein [Francisella philomiragia]MBK2278763.1 hypothetical protein [Francisella philomiragia]MBK2286617.1 hypothetical protein [Francisella philomiragia]MBK2288509.1 hypothetical protein [Francisella philomiragia]